MIRIVVEGPAKSGKTTLLPLIADALRDAEIPLDVEDVDGSLRHVLQDYVPRLERLRAWLQDNKQHVVVTERQLFRMVSD